MTVSASADLSRTSEYVDISLNDVPVGTLFVFNGADCVVPPNTDSLIVSAAVYNGAIDGGDAVIAMLPSDGLDPGVCAETFVAVEVSYLTASNRADCNGTGVPDECENLYDGSGSVDLGDYRFLVRCLSGPEAAPQPGDVACESSCLEGFDFDGDADVDLKDASEFLRLFAP
ncbi:MAG: hypothetical protein IH987_07625 [Planctomycetes bacterium]|nr:hypothetical protein [Planctomycetota bacterium]